MDCVVKNSDETRFGGNPHPTRYDLTKRPPHTNLYDIYTRFHECREPLQRDVWMDFRVRAMDGGLNRTPYLEHTGLVAATFYRQVNHPELFSEYGFSPALAKPQITGSWRLTFADRNAALAYYIGFSYLFYHTEGWE